VSCLGTAIVLASLLTGCTEKTPGRNCPGKGWRDLSHREVDGSELIERRLHCANLEWSSLDELRLQEVKLSRANLHGASLRSSWLSNVDLSGADLREAVLEAATLDEVDMEGADLQSASLTVLAIPSASPGSTHVLDDWENNQNTEQRRVLYVGASRAAKILVLVVPPGKRSNQLERILVRHDVPHTITKAE
jgi:hypothetical protein